VIPSFDFELTNQLPPGTSFWTPDRDEIGDDCFGFFQDGWPILDIDRNMAQEMLDLDFRMVDLVASAAPDPTTFDRVSAAVEGADVEALPTDLQEETALVESIRDLGDEPPLYGLEVGVAGLVHALAAAGCFPAASCRGHTESHSWSKEPVVYLAADREHAKLLESLIQDSDCGFDIDPDRPELLVLVARSLNATLWLAQAILETLNPGDTNQDPLY